MNAKKLIFFLLLTFPLEFAYSETPGCGEDALIPKDIVSQISKRYETVKSLQAEFSRSTLANACRTDADIRLPFENASSAGLRLVTSRLQHVPCAFRKTWLASGKTAEGKVKFFLCQLYVS